MKFTVSKPPTGFCGQLQLLSEVVFAFATLQLVPLSRLSQILLIAWLIVALALLNSTDSEYSFPNFCSFPYADVSETPLLISEVQLSHRLAHVESAGGT